MTRNAAFGADAEATRSTRKPCAKNILAVDIGGTFIKAGVVDEAGVLLCPWTRLATPHAATPDDVIAVITALARSLPGFGRISIAFPGAIRGGRVLTAPNLGQGGWHGVDLAGEVCRLFGCEVRVLNDAMVQALDVAEGQGLQCLLTLGTGMGFALMRDATFLVQLELGRHFACEGFCYDSYIGHAAYLAVGPLAWNARVERTVDAMRALVNFDRLYLGGGNARRIRFALPTDEKIIAMTAGITGGLDYGIRITTRYFRGGRHDSLARLDCRRGYD